MRWAMGLRSHRKGMGMPCNKRESDRKEVSLSGGGFRCGGGELFFFMKL